VWEEWDEQKNHASEQRKRGGEGGNPKKLCSIVNSSERSGSRFVGESEGWAGGEGGKGWKGKQRVGGGPGEIHGPLLKIITAGRNDEAEPTKKKGSLPDRAEGAAWDKTKKGMDEVRSTSVVRRSAWALCGTDGFKAASI